MKKNYLYSVIQQFTDVKAGQVVTIQIMRTGKRKHPVYGEFEVGPEILQEVVKNFKEDKRGIELAVDENHDRNHIALGRIRDVYLEDNDHKAFAKIELTELGAEKLARGEYKYFSPEIIRDDTDDETGEQISNLLVGGAFTNRPYFKGMQSLKYSEDDLTNDEDITFYSFSEEQPMNKLLKLLQGLMSKDQLDKAELAEADKMYADQKGSEDKEVAELYSKLQEKKKAQFSEDEGNDDGGDEGGDDQGSDDDAGDQDEGADKGGDADEGADKVAKFTDPETGKVTTMSFAELKSMQDKIKSFEFAEKKKTVSDKVSSFVFSEENKTALALPKHKDKIIDFAMGLSDKQFQAFSEIITNLTTEASKLFGEEGSGEEGGNSDLTRDQKVDNKAHELLEAKKFTDYKDAVLHANMMFNEDGEFIEGSDQD